MGKHLLYIQIALLALLFYFGNLERILSNIPLAILFMAGTTLALWAFYNMGSKNYSPFPQPRSAGKFTQKGAYKYMRHPMYTGVLLIAAALLLSNFYFPSFIVFAALAYVLDEKATLEENLLVKMHPEYKNYLPKTRKFIPFVY